MASYLPFGCVHVATGGIDLRFSGQWFQAESGLHQNWMRDYDPTTGRYLEPDPMGLVPGPSLYGYSNQNPLYWTDPTGECPWCIPVAIYIGWLVVDYLLDDDGCYTWGDFAWSAISNLDPFKIGKALHLAEKAGQGANGANRFAKAVRTRPAPGRDGSQSDHIIESLDGNVTSVTHRVTDPAGNVVHQHQTHIGRYGTERRFPDEWIEFPTIPR